MDLPQYNKSAKIGKKGITILSRIVEAELNWILRINHQEDDFGIDAYIDIISGKKQVTGKSIAIQVKSGESYFKYKNQFGWKFYGEMRHLNYYLNHEIPVLLVIVDTNKHKAFWALCDANQTEKHDKRWSITIPNNQPLNIANKNELLKHVSPTIDYVSQLEHFWEINKVLKSAEQLIIIADKDDVLSGNYLPLIEGLNRLEQNKELLLTHKENVEISILGYDSDPRELYEILEVKEWVKNIIDNVEGIAFFLVNDNLAQFLKLILFCNIETKTIDSNETYVNGILRRKVGFNSSDIANVLISLFYNLNSFCKRNNISEKLIKEISGNITNCFSGE